MSKTRVSQIRRQLESEGIVIAVRGQRRIAQVRRLRERLLKGYADRLRPKLVTGRYRYAEQTPAAFLSRLANEAPRLRLRYSLTGTPAAHLLKRCHRDMSIPLFVRGFTDSARKKLSLLPDRDGPLTVLSAFGKLVFWKQVERHTIAPPWLIYAELMSGNDPRAHEAAEELRREYLA